MDIKEKNLRKKIYGTIIGLGILVFFASTIINVVIGARLIVTLSTLFIGIALSVALYLFLKKDMYRLSRTITFATILFFAPIFWKFDGGIQQTIPYYILSYVTITVILLSGREKVFYLSLSGILITVFLILEMINPEGIHHGNTKYYALVNNALGTVTVGFLITALLSIFLSHYQKIKEELELSNKRLYEANKKLEELSRKDPLTGLSNRRDMIERIANEIDRIRRDGGVFSLIMGDIDDFKKINDTYGHECGDLVLKRISEIMQAELRRYDIVARWGGEEFLILLPQTNEEKATMIAKRLREIIAQDFLLYNDKIITYTITFGIIEDDDPTIDMDEYIKKVDMALYQGKKDGKNREVVYKSIE